MSSLYRNMAHVTYIIALVLAASACGDDRLGTRQYVQPLTISNYLVVYDDGALAPGFEQLGNDNIDLQSTAQVHSGSTAMALDVSHTWRYYAFSASSAIDLDQYCSLEAYVNGGSTGSQIVDFRPSIFWSPPTDDLGYCGDAGPISNYVEGGSVPANAWAKLTLELNSACWDAGSNGGGFMVLTDGLDDQGTLYIDDVRLVCCTPRCAGECTPDCDGKQCGDDGCGGSCGSCGVDQVCNPAQRCEATCTPDCDGKQCGDDGCGGSCGSCSSGQVCSAGSCEGQSSGSSRDFLTIYADGTLAPGFQSVGYDQIDLASTQQVYSGTSAMAMDVSQAWKYYAISAASAIDLTQFCKLEAYVNGGAAGGQDVDFRPSIYWSPPSADLGYCDDAGTLANHIAGGTVPANAWAQLSVDLTNACWNVGANGGGFMLLTNDKQGQGTLYMDDVRLVCCTPGCVEAGRTCTPNCAGKQCGSDGCGGSCGTCTAGTSCNASQQCQAPSGGSTLISRFDPTNPPIYGYRVVAQYPHDTEAFTEGLFARDDQLYEGVGRRWLTSVRQVAIGTGTILNQTDLVYADARALLGDSFPAPTEAGAAAGEYFGEGTAPDGEYLVQLTWTSGVGFVYDRDTLTLRDAFTYSGEGWGLTNDGTYLVHGDGTPSLRFRQAGVGSTDFFKVMREVRVSCQGALAQTLVGWRDGQQQKLCRDGELWFLNELEAVQGYIFANVWQTSYIAVIDPETGALGAWIDLSGLSNPVGHLNGIAFDDQQRRLFVTGKLWPVLYEIDLVAPR